MMGSTSEEIKKSKDLPPLSTSLNSREAPQQNLKSVAAPITGTSHKTFSYHGDEKKGEKGSESKDGIFLNK